MAHGDSRLTVSWTAILASFIPIPLVIVFYSFVALTQWRRYKSVKYLDVHRQKTGQQLTSTVTSTDKK